MVLKLDEKELEHFAKLIPLWGLSSRLAMSFAPSKGTFFCKMLYSLPDDEGSRNALIVLLSEKDRFYWYRWYVMIWLTH
jgi:hypothetical protein